MKGVILSLICLALNSGCQLEFKEKPKEVEFKSRQINSVTFTAMTSSDSETITEVSGSLLLTKNEELTNEIPITLELDKNYLKIEMEDDSQELLKEVESVSVPELSLKESREHVSFSTEKEGSFVQVSVFNIQKIIKNNEIRLRLKSLEKDRDILIRFRKPPVIDSEIIFDRGLIAILKDKEVVSVKGKEHKALNFISLKNRSDYEVKYNLKTLKSDLKIERWVNLQSVNQDDKCSFKSNLQTKKVKESSFYLIPLSKGYLEAISSLSLFNEESEISVSLKPLETLYLGVYINGDYPLEDFITTKGWIKSKFEVGVSCSDKCDGDHLYTHVNTKVGAVGGPLKLWTVINLGDSISYSYSGEYESVNPVVIKFDINKSWEQETRFHSSIIQYAHPKKWMKKKNGCYKPPQPGRCSGGFGLGCPPL